MSADFIGPVQKNAKGTNFHPGGPAMVNDQKGPMYEELVQLLVEIRLFQKGEMLFLICPEVQKF